MNPIEHGVLLVLREDGGIEIVPDDVGNGRPRERRAGKRHAALNLGQDHMIEPQAAVAGDFALAHHHAMHLGVFEPDVRLGVGGQHHDEVLVVAHRRPHGGILRRHAAAARGKQFHPHVVPPLRSEIVPLRQEEGGLDEFALSLGKRCGAKHRHPVVRLVDIQGIVVGVGGIRPQHSGIIKVIGLERLHHGDEVPRLDVGIFQGRLFFLLGLFFLGFLVLVLVLVLGRGIGSDGVRQDLADDGIEVRLGLFGLFFSLPVLFLLFLVVHPLFLLSSRLLLAAAAAGQRNRANQEQNEQRGELQGKRAARGNALHKQSVTRIQRQKCRFTEITGNIGAHGAIPGVLDAEKPSYTYRRSPSQLIPQSKGCNRKKKVVGAKNEG